MSQQHPAQSGTLAVAFRFAGQGGGDTRLYVLPGLEEVTWRFRTPGLAVQRVIGFSRDQDEVYVLTERQVLMGLDLSLGRARVIDSSVADGALGPTGILHYVKTDGTVGALEYRSATAWNATMEHPPTSLWGGQERLLATVPEGDHTELLALARGKSAVRQLLPPGPVSVALWGDLAAVAVDSGVLLIDPQEEAHRRFVRLRSGAEAVTFAPAGHRIYAAEPNGRLAIIDRYSADVLTRLRLPGPATALRADPFGRLLLAHAAAGDSLWVVDLTVEQIVGGVECDWREDLPTVAPDGTVLIARGGDVVAIDPQALTVRGTVAGGATDRWLTASWDPRRPALPTASSAAAPQAAPPGEEIYVQVSSTANEAWAQDLARNLRAAGMQASVLAPTLDDDRYRVVLGPYPTRDAAEATGRKLGRPFWIFTREGPKPSP